MSEWKDVENHLLNEALKGTHLYLFTLLICMLENHKELSESL